MGKRIAVRVSVLAAGALVCIGVYALLNWKDVQTVYHFRVLLWDPEHLERILDSPAGSPREAAIIRYVQHPEGARHLLRLYVSGLMEATAKPDNIRSAGSGVLLTYSPTGNRLLWRTWSRASRGFSGGGGQRITDERLATLHGLVEEHRVLDYEGFELSGDRSFVFQVLPRHWEAIFTSRNSRRFGSRSAARFTSRRGGGGTVNAGDDEESSDIVCVGLRKSGTGMMPLPRETVPALLRELASKDPRDRALAGKLLAEIGCDPEDPVPFLLSAIEPWPAGIQTTWVESISALDARHVPSLLGALQDDDPAVRHLVLLGLIGREPDAATAMPIYLAAAKDEEERIRGAAIHGLETLGPVALAALTELIEEYPVSVRALQAIGRLGPAAKVAVPDILDWIRRHPDHRRKAAEAVLQIEPGNAEAQAVLDELNAVPPSSPAAPQGVELTRALARVEDLRQAKNYMELARMASVASAENRAVPQAAFRALKEADADAVPALGELAKNQDPTLSVVAVLQLSQRGSEAVPALVGALENPAIRSMACSALGRLGAEAREAIPHLEKLLENARGPGPALALLRIDRTTADIAVPKILDTLRTTDKRIWDTHLRTLVELLGKDLAPYLETARESDDGPLRRAAMRGLELLKEGAAER